MCMWCTGVHKSSVWYVGGGGVKTLMYHFLSSHHTHIHTHTHTRSALDKVQSRIKAKQEEERSSRLRVALSYQTMVMESFSKAIALGESMDEEWIVLNCAAELWNIHIHVFRRQKSVLSAALSYADALFYGRLEDDGLVNPMSTELTACLSNVIRHLQHLNVTDSSLLGKLAAQVAFSFEFDRKFKDSIALCEETLDLCTLSDKESLVKCYTRAHMVTGVFPPLPGDRESNILVCIEAMRCAGASADQKDEAVEMMLKLFQEPRNSQSAGTSLSLSLFFSLSVCVHVCMCVCRCLSHVVKQITMCLFVHITS
jgi:hypothetical protein